MSEELYITGPVIVNGIPDTDEDTLDSVEIRTIFTKYTKHLSDIQHDSIDYEGVDVLANWISNEDTVIAGNTIPAKSWLATVKVTDPETLTAINKNELRCFSLGSVSRDAKTRDAWFINKRISYHDLKSIDDVIPLRISIVDDGACGFPFEVETREVYINKNKKKEDEAMAKENEDKKFSLEDLKIIKSIFGKSDEEETKIEKAEEDTPDEQEKTNEKSIDALFEKVDTLINDVAEIKQALADNSIEKSEEEEEEEKSSDEEEKEEEEEKIEKADEEESEDKDEEEKEEETKIEKRTEKVADIPQSIETTPTFFKRTNRDELGRKIRK